MMILVQGPPDSGKSERAEKLALQLKAPGDPRLLYLATMIPFGEEGLARVRKHRAMREGKGFLTLEIPRDLPAAEEALKEYAGGTCLLECVANLAGNEMHAPENAGRRPEELEALILREILWLKEHMKHLVVVTDIFTESPEMDEETLRYIRLINAVNHALIRAADRTEGTHEDS